MGVACGMGTGVGMRIGSFMRMGVGAVCGGDAGSGKGVQGGGEGVLR